MVMNTARPPWEFQLCFIRNPEQMSRFEYDIDNKMSKKVNLHKIPDT
jgi:hypothetical protein